MLKGNQLKIFYVSINYMKNTVVKFILEILFSLLNQNHIVCIA